MKRLHLIAAIALIALFQSYCHAQYPIAASDDLSAFVSTTSTATNHSYKLIAGPKVVDQRTAESVITQPNTEVKVGMPYAYGWFGAPSKPHWNRQFGYGRRYTQWTLK
jgi:hypothetical protein